MNLFITKPSILEQPVHTGKDFSLNEQDYYLYLGKDNNFIHEFSLNCTPQIFSFQTYRGGKDFILNLKKKHNALPGAIIIDLPLNLKELKLFTDWMLSSETMKIVPVIYNQRVLSLEDIILLRDSKIVDDISSVYQQGDKLISKMHFLKEMKIRSFKKQEPIFSEANAKSFSQLLNTVSKRFLNILISSIALICLSPVFIFVALLIRLESKGPIFYISKRAGKGFKVFNFYKFRTMIVDADKKVKELQALNVYQDGKANFFKIKNDPRITKIGSFLRNSSLDEIPQLLNVLKGDMSIVGNRPLPLYEASTLITDEWAERFMAPAGITGLWQIKKRGNDDMSVEERITLDITYARTNNVIKDLWIMANTPAALIQKSNV